MNTHAATKVFLGISIIACATMLGSCVPVPAAAVTPSAAADTQQTPAPAAPPTSIGVATLAPASMTQAAECISSTNRESLGRLNTWLAQFDDYAVLATNIVQEQVALVIPPMQAVRDHVSGEQVPACLAELKQAEIQYMDAVLTALANFKADTNTAVLSGAIQAARQYRTIYDALLLQVAGATATP